MRCVARLLLVRHVLAGLEGPDEVEGRVGEGHLQGVGDLGRRGGATLRRERVGGSKDRVWLVGEREAHMQAPCLEGDLVGEACLGSEGGGTLDLERRERDACARGQGSGKDGCR